MQSRRDQLHAYRFLTRRAVSAVVTGDPDIPESPMRRTSITTISGIMIAIVVAAGAYVVGLLKPGSTDAWKDPGTIIVERETGARYILSDNKLRPTVNFASAVLALSKATQDSPPKVASVARSKLSDVQRGSQIGILGLPDSLPSKSQLITRGFAVCAEQQTPDKGRSQIRSTLYLGGNPASTALPADSGVFVRTVGGQGREYLLWHGLRFGVDDSNADALGLSGQSPVAVSTAFVDAFSPAPDFRHPQIDGIGSAGPTIGGQPTKIGDILTTGSSFFLVSAPTAVASISKFVAQLAAAGPNSPGVRKIVSSDLTNVNNQPLGLTIGLPDVEPPLQNTAAAAVGGVCVDYLDGKATPELRVPSQAPDGLGGNAQTFESAQSLAGAVDGVVLPAGRAAVLAARNADGSKPTTAFLVAEPGKRFAVDPGLLPAFGYTADTEFVLPANLVLLIPAGPAMDPTAALSPPG